MIDRFMQAVRKHAADLDSGKSHPMFGLVAGYDPTNGTARVRLQPENTLTGWLPILSQWVGSGWGMVCPPTLGDQCLVLGQEGDIENGIIVGRCFSDQQLPPPAPSGEFWLVHKSGTFLKLMNDGTVQVHGDLHVDGNIFTTQSVIANAEVVANNGAGAVHLSTHLHHTGASNTGGPVAGT